MQFPLDLAYRHEASLHDQFGNVPNAVSDSGLHGGSDAKAFVDPAKVVVGEVQAERGSQVFPLLTEAIRKPRQPANLHAHW